MSGPPSRPRTLSQYRQHDRATGPFATPVQRQLAQEWVRLHRDPATGVTMRRWARSCPVLDGASRPGEVVDAVDAAPPERKDAILIALIELAQGRQHLAGRIVLQAMLPKLTSHAYRVRARLRGSTSLEEAFQLVLGEFWDVVSTYPVTRRRAKVAANLAMETWHRLTPSRGAAEIPWSPETLVAVAETTDPIGSVGGELEADCSLAELLAWGRARAVVSADDAHLLTELYADRGDTRGSYRDVARAYRRIAERTGTRPAALRQRVRRAKQRLSAAAQLAVQSA